MKSTYLIVLPSLLVLPGIVLGACRSNNEDPTLTPREGAGGGFTASAGAAANVAGSSSSSAGQGGQAGQSGGAAGAAGQGGATAESTPPVKKPCDAAADGATETRVMYAAASVPVGQTCLSEQQQRVCQDGTWLPWSGTLASPTCAPEPPPPRNWCGGVPASEGKETSSCALLMVTCANGSVGNNSFRPTYGNTIDAGNRNCRAAAQDCLTQCGPGSKLTYLSPGCAPESDCQSFFGGWTGVGTVSN